VKNLNKLTPSERAKYVLIRLKNVIARCPQIIPNAAYIKTELLKEQQIMWNINKETPLPLETTEGLELICEHLEQNVELYEKNS
jgi:hypothetical protein